MRSGVFKLAAAVAVLSSAAPHTMAATTINATNRNAYGANIGWLNARGEITNGAVIGQFFCTGFVWSPNCGWISLGHGPTNGWSYGNTTTDNWGVNVDRLGRLRGAAYGANIGWLKFETNGNPRVDRFTGNFAGYAFGANVGWIALSNVTGHVRTDTLEAGPDSDGDGIPDAWERFMSAGSLTNLNGGAADADHDGQSDRAEYAADTDPLNPSAQLKITSFARTPATSLISWSVEPTRLYRLEQTDRATNGAVWADSGLGALLPGPGVTLTGVVANAAVTTRTYRVSVSVP